MTVSIAALALTATSTANHQPAVILSIDKARHQTHQCQTQLGLKPYAVSSQPIVGHRYARWVLALWQARADAYCGLIRTLQGRGARVLRHVIDPCLARIIDMENVVWDPTIGYGFRHGNVHEAYGLPQARPGTKMASAGADWQTNPITQIRWMTGYVNARYGGACAALEHRRTAGWY